MDTVQDDTFQRSGIGCSFVEINVGQSIRNSAEVGR